MIGVDDGEDGLVAAPDERTLARERAAAFAELMLRRVRVRDAAGDYHRFTTVEAAQEWIGRRYPGVAYGMPIEHHGEWYQLAYPVQPADEDEASCAKIVWTVAP